MRAGHIDIQATERVLFGVAAATAVSDEAARYGAQRVFVLSNRSLAALDDGPLSRVVDKLGATCVGSFTAISAHSRRDDVIAAAAEARAASPDLLVAVGGGSVIDAAKAVQLCLWLELETTAAMAPYLGESARLAMAPAEAIRVLAVPTTLSGAEFTATAGINDTQTRTKEMAGHRLFAPRSVILDPAATLATPQALFLATGVRALDHAVESYCSPRANPVTEPLSLQGLRLLGRALPQIRARPGDLAPRLEAQVGAWQAVAAVAAGAGVGASHGIGYVLGGSYGVSHGETSCVMLPAVLRWNAAAGSGRQRALAEALGAPERALADLVSELVGALGLPQSLRDLGIARASLDDIAQRALAYEPVRMNPRPIDGPADLRQILELAW